MTRYPERPTRRPRIGRPARWAVAAVLTAGVTVLLAHEGHAPLPTKGAVVDVERGHVLLTPDARESIDVQTAEVEVRPVEEKVLAYATVVAPWTHHGFATARLPGRISKVMVAPGQTVRAGDAVAEVQSLELDTLQLELLTARNDIALSEKTVKELRRTVEAGSVSGQALLDAESKHFQNLNSLAVAKSKWLGLGLTTQSLDDLFRRGQADPGLTLPARTPVSGTVVHAELTAGKVVEPAEHLAEVVDLSTVWVRIGVLEKDLHRVEVGHPVELHLVAYPGEVFRTAVKAKGLYLDPASHLNTVWAELENPATREPKFQPGMAGQAFLVVSGEKPRPTVPATAIVREGADRFVLVEEASAAGSSEYRKKPVVVGRRSGGKVEILGGELFPGDRVVTRGSHELGGFFVPGVLRLTPEAERNVGLKVEPARMIAVDEVVALDGAVDVPPGGRGFAASQLAGTILSIRADRGATVRPGDVLAEIFSPELQTLQLELIRADLALRLESETLGRIKDLPAVPRQRVWETESRVNGLTAQKDTLRRKLETAGLAAAQVDAVLKTKELVPSLPVRATIGGVVANFDKVLGQAVLAHEPIFEIHDLSRPFVQGFVSERDTARVRIGQAVRVRLVSDPGYLGTGRVVRSGRTFGEGSRSQSVWVELDTLPGYPLRHGQLARLAAVVGTRPPGLAVPKSAVVADGTSSFVFVRRPDGVFDRRAVELGPEDDRFLTVTGGLAEGETVAVRGAGELMTAFASLR